MKVVLLSGSHLRHYYVANTLLEMAGYMDTLSNREKLLYLLLQKD